MSLELDRYVLQDPSKEILTNGSINPLFKIWKNQDEMLGC